MGKNLDLLAGELQQAAGGDVVLCNPDANELVLLVHVDDARAAKFIELLRNPRLHTFRDPDSPIGTEQRYETPTEAALRIFKTTPAALAYDLTLLRGYGEVLFGDLYVDGFEVCVVLVDHDRARLAELASVTRSASDGSVYPLFEPAELTLGETSRVLAAGRR